MLKKIEVSGINQKVLEDMYHRKIHECNEIIKRFNSKYNNWEEVEEKIKSRYSREEYKKFFIDSQREKRKDYIYKLKTVRNGYIYE